MITTCKQCNAAFKAKPYLVRRGQGLFCNHTCHAGWVRAQTDLTRIERFWARVKKSEDCWLWQGGQDIHGYGVLNKKCWGERTAHRYSWLLHSRAIPQGLFVLHKCDNPQCVRPDHLFLGNQTDNMSDMRTKGRGSNPPVRFGEKNNKAKLSDLSVAELRQRNAAGERPMALARDYGITYVQVWNILTGRQRQAVGIAGV